MSDEQERLQELESRLSYIEKFFHIPKDAHKKEKKNEQKRVARESFEEEAIILYIQKNWPAIVGSLFILCGLGWLLIYGFLHNWLTKTTWFSLYVLGSFSIYGIGGFFLSRKKLLGEIVITLGLSCAMVALWGGMKFQVFPCVCALSCMAVMTLLTLIISLVHKNEFLACLSTFNLIIIPDLTDTANFNLDIANIYYCSIVISSAFLLLQKKWAFPMLVALLSTLRMLGAFLTSLHNDAAMNMFLAYTLYEITLFSFVIPWLLIIHLERKNWQHLYRIGSFILFFSILWILIGESPLSSLSLLALFVVFLSGLYKLCQYDSSTKSEKLLSIIVLWGAVETIGLFTTKYFNGSLLISLCFVEIALGIYFAWIFLRSPTIAQILSYLYLFFCFSSKEQLISCSSFSSWNFWLLVFGTSTSFFIARIFQDRTNRSTSHLLYIFYCLASLFSIEIVWSVCHNLISSGEVARMVTLIFYSLAGLLISFVATNRHVRQGGLILISGVAIRLLAVEISDMPMGKRIITFVSIGAIFLASALIDWKKKRSAKMGSMS